MEAETSRDFPRVDLKEFERSPKLAEIRAVYKSRTKVGTRKAVRQPADVVEYLRAIWNPRTIELTEDFIVVCLNHAHQVIGWVKVASGSFNACQIEPRVIFAIALQTASSALILAHNHPSGDLTPSRGDREVTEKLTDAGRLLNIDILDHIILTKESSFSLAENRRI